MTLVDGALAKQLSAIRYPHPLSEPDEITRIVDRLAKAYPLQVNDTTLSVDAEFRGLGV